MLVLALILLIGSPLLVPYLATTLLAEKMAFAMNRPVTIARAEFDPLTCTLTLRHLIVGPKLSKPDDPVDPLLSAGKISIAFAPERLLNKELACNMNADHFFLHLVRDKDGRYNLGLTMNELLPDGLPVAPLQFSWNSITATNSRLVFDDEQTGKNHLAEEISLSIPPGPTSPLGLQAKINGVPITLPDTINSAQPLKPEPTKQEDPIASGTPDDSALKTAEAIALIHNLDQAAKQYLQKTVTTPAERRTPIAP